MKKWIFRGNFLASILANIGFILTYAVASLNELTGKVGILKEDVPLATYMTDSGVYLTLPKGLVVRDSSPNYLALAGLFEPERFIIEVTSNRGLVDYSYQNTEKSFGSLYSADTYFNFENDTYELPNP